MTRLRAAIALAEHGDENRALAEAHELLTEHPDFAPAWKFQAALLEDLGQREQAAASYQTALKLAPGDPELMLKVGIDDLVSGENAEAIRLFNRRLKLLPQDGDTLFYLAQAYHRNGDSDLALKTIQQCLKADPANPAVWQKYGELLCSSGDNENALHWLEKAQHADPSLDRLDFDLAVVRYRSMDLTPALAYASKAAQEHPNDVNALALLAAIDVILARWQDAEPIFQTILSARSEDAASELGLGHCELELKEYQQAADTLERVIQQDPTQILAHFYLSRAYSALGRTADAQHEAELHRRMLEQASTAAPAGDESRQDAVWNQARQELSEDHETQALELFRSSAKGPYATPGGPYVFVGALYLNLGRSDDASRALHQALQLEPGVRGAHTYLGMLALEQDDLEAAEREFKAELARDPNDQAATAQLGDVRYLQGRWAEAADLLSRSHTTAPGLLYLLADAYFRLGNVKDADLTAELAVDYANRQMEVIARVVDLLRRHQQLDLAQKLAAKLPS